VSRDYAAQGVAHNMDLLEFKKVNEGNRVVYQVVQSKMGAADLRLAYAPVIKNYRFKV
jgi:hypothetical protein